MSEPESANTNTQYCEYGGKVKKCQDWLQANQKELYDVIWSAGMC